MGLQTSRAWLSKRLVLNGVFALAVLIALLAGYTITRTRARPAAPLSANQAFTQASQATGVPVELLKAICYMEGRISNNNGEASIDNGFGCMHLVKNQNFDTLDKAADELGVSVPKLKQDLATNILGGTHILRDDALQLSANLPTHLGDWYGALVIYSDASVRSTALMYADAVYKILQQGFTITSDQGETVTLAPQVVTPNTATAATVHAFAASLPAGCKNDGNVDYPGAIDCILDPNTYDCNLVPTTDCNFTGSNRPTKCSVNYGSPSAPNIVVTQPCKINQIVIHDIEGTPASALSVFQNPQSQASAHYIVGADGTVYQVVREHDIAYHDGNFWSNMHSIGIEHEGWDSTGYRYYNATEYLASAKLVTYLLKKYAIPLDHSHVAAHATVYTDKPDTWNHVDPGPYWLWDYYFNLISQQGVPNASTYAPPNTITLHPKSDQQPDGSNGTETQANYNFFYLYNGPSTKSGLIPQLGTNDPTDVSYNIEPDISYYFVDKATDAAGTGDTMYEIWYGVLDQHNAAHGYSYFADAKLVWLAVPPGDGVEGHGVLPDSPSRIVLSSNSGNPQIYSRPTSNSQYVMGAAPAGAVFTTAFSVTEDNGNTIWYEINFNHRQAWIPASEVSPFHPL